jgi:hypothetical protein
MFCDRPRLCTQPCIEIGLSAAGLVWCELHGYAKALENIHDGLACLRVERIDETCDKELDSRHDSIVIGIPSFTAQATKRKYFPFLH